MLYVFAGFPGHRGDKLGLHAGGLAFCIDEVEELGLLERRLCYRKGGVFTPGPEGEYLYDVEYRLSDNLRIDGITWDWFAHDWNFGNTTVCHKTMGGPRYRKMVYGTDTTLADFQAAHLGKPYPANLMVVDEIEQSNSWIEYQARWLPGTCPQEAHLVHLTWVVMEHKMPEFAYERLRQLIEDAAEPKDIHRYSTDKGHHFSTIRTWEGQHALPGI